VSTKAPRKPVIRTPYVKLPSRRLLFVYWGVKALAIGVGFFGTLLCLMAAVGSVTESLPLRIVGGLLATAALPLGIGLALRRRSEEQRPLDLFSDVFAVVWLGFVFVFAFALGGLTSDLLVGESTRLTSDGVEPAAGAVALLAGGLPDAGTDADAGDADTDASDAGDASVFSGPAPGPSILILAPPRDAPEPKGEAPHASFAELMQLAGSAVVTLTGRGKNGSVGGTGFLVDATGTIVTAHDVVENASELSVRFEKNGSTFNEVVLLLDDPAKGLALLWVDLERTDAGTPEGFPKPLRLRMGRGTTPGERALVLANPLGMDLTLTEGAVLGRVSRDGREVLQLSYVVPQGAEGAPVVDSLGDVVGVVIGASEEARGAAVAAPADVLSALLKPGYPDRRWIGGAN
jgi:S1-C subfamily serine protease